MRSRTIPPANPGTREGCLTAIDFLQPEACDYEGPTAKGPRPYCDCKFGAKHGQARGLEQNGCPELRTLSVLLRGMTDEQFAEAIARGMGRR